MLHARWPALHITLKHSFNTFLGTLLIMDVYVVDWAVNSTFLVILIWFLHNTVINLVSGRAAIRLLAQFFYQCTGQVSQLSFRR